MEGNQCHKFIKDKNLDKLEELLNKDGIPEDIISMYIQCFSDLRNVYNACCRNTLNKSYQHFTDKLKKSWSAHAIPNKVHFITDHFSDYFESPFSNGEGLGTTTDQIIDYLHSFMETQKIKVTD